MAHGKAVKTILLEHILAHTMKIIDIFLSFFTWILKYGLNTAWKDFFLTLTLIF